MANCARRVRESLFEYARTVAEEENVSMTQFFVAAIAEKVSALQTGSYFRERAARNKESAFRAPSPMRKTRSSLDQNLTTVGKNSSQKGSKFN
jgi:hypothetical protein